MNTTTLLVRRSPVTRLGLGESIAIDVGLMAVLGVTASLAFGFAWLMLKAGGLI